jgi:hypothetical protein
LVISELIVARLSAWLTVFERHQIEILTTFGLWIVTVLGGLDWRRLLKTGDNYCTVIAIPKLVTLDRASRQANWMGEEDTSLKLFVKTDIKKKTPWTDSAYPNGAQFSQSISKQC